MDTKWVNTSFHFFWGGGGCFVFNLDIRHSDRVLRALMLVIFVAVALLVTALQ